MLDGPNMPALPEDVDVAERRTFDFLSQHGLRVRPMEARELAAVLSADGAIYATSSPARLDTVREWCAKVPDWGFVMEAQEQRTDTSIASAEGGSCSRGLANSTGTSSSSGSSSSSSGSGSSPGSGHAGPGRWSPLGVCIMIPISAAGWQALISGALQESDMRDSGGGSNAGAGADGDSNSAGTNTSSHQSHHHQHQHPRLLHDPDAADHSCMGLHIYHMERTPAYPPHLPTFGLLALYGIALGMCATQRRRRRAGLPGPLRLVGMSGLAVSPTGISLTSVLYGSREQGYISNEFVFRAPPVQPHPLQPQPQPPQASARGGGCGFGSERVGGTGDRDGDDMGDAAEADGRSSFGLYHGGGGSDGGGGTGEGGGGGGPLSGVLSGTRRLVAKRKLEVHSLHTQEEMDALLRAGYEFVARCRMTLQYTTEPSLVWTIVPRALDGPAAAAAAGAGAAVARPPPPPSPPAAVARAAPTSAAGALVMVPRAVALQPGAGPLLARL